MAEIPPPRSNLVASLSEVKIVSIDGFKAAFKIKECDAIICEGDTFVRLDPRNTSLCHVVSELNPKVPSPLPKNFSLSCSNGLSSLTKLRNEARSHAAADTAPEKCNLFGGGEEPPVKMPRLSRAETIKKRLEPEVLGVSITTESGTFDVQVLSPVGVADTVYVKYDSSTMANVIEYLRDQGFREPKQRQPLPIEEGVKGIHARKGHYIVVFGKNNGTKGYRKCRDLEHAIATHNQLNVVGVDDIEAEDENDGENDEQDALDEPEAGLSQEA